MRVSITVALFQDKMSILLQYMIHDLLYMHNLVIINNYTFKKHMDILNDVLLRL